MYTTADADGVLERARKLPAPRTVRAFDAAFVDALSEKAAEAGAASPCPAVGFATCAPTRPFESPPVSQEGGAVT